jgi:hypothetical protein
LKPTRRGFKLWVNCICELAQPHHGGGGDPRGEGVRARGAARRTRGVLNICGALHLRRRRGAPRAETLREAPHLAPPLRAALTPGGVVRWVTWTPEWLRGRQDGYMDGRMVTWILAFINRTVF